MLSSPKFINLLITATSIVSIHSFRSIAANSWQFFIHQSLNFSLNSPALASDRVKTKPKFRYVPPTRRAPKSTQATGSRGCIQSQSQPVTLTLLAPKDHDGLTISGHPTFFWDVSAPAPMVFTLTVPGVAQPLFEQQIQAQSAGIVQLKMPQNLAELVPDREYRWSVSLICNQNRPSANAFVQSWIKRVPATSQLKQKIAATPSERDRAKIYAEAGLWYDALEAISTVYKNNPKDTSLLEDRLSLLEQVGLTLHQLPNTSSN